MIDGPKFSRSTVKVKEGGKDSTLELNIHVDGPKGKLYLVVVGDESTNFPRSSMELRSIFETVKVGSNLPSSTNSSYPTYRPSPPRPR